MYKPQLQITKQEIETLLKSGKTNKEIGQLLGREHGTISRWRQKLGIAAKLGSLKGPRPERRRIVYGHCKTCATPIESIPSYIKMYCSRTCVFECPEYRAKLAAIDKSYLQTPEFRLSRTKPETPEFTRYKNRVHKLSEQIYQQHKEEINPENHKRTLAGVKDGYQLDHIKTVRECFDEGISPQLAASLENLRLLPWKDNLGRNKRVNISQD